MAGVAGTVAALYSVFVLANTVVVGPMSLVPVPGLSHWLYVQDALDIIAATAMVVGGAIILDRLLEREQRLQSAVMDGMARVIDLARRIAETAEFRERVSLDQPGLSASEPAPPAAVLELAATFNAMLARLEDAFEAQRRLLADTSHELRNPLTVLRTNLALVQRDDLATPMRSEAAREAEEEAARLARLVDDLLLLGRGNAGDLLSLRAMRVSALVAATAEEAREAGTGHQVILDPSPEVVIYADPDRVRQVLRNVIGNALRHTPAGTLVRLAVVTTEWSADIVVADNGPGIAPEHLSHIFDRFYRVDSARARFSSDHPAGHVTGAGLGLSIVKHLMEAHHGNVNVESVTGPGTRSGTTVRLSFPTTTRGS